MRSKARFTHRVNTDDFICGLGIDNYFVSLSQKNEATVHHWIEDVTIDGEPIAAIVANRYVLGGRAIDKLGAYEDIDPDPQWVAEAVAAYRSAYEASCNVCKRAVDGNCEWLPNWGEPCRMNCPFFVEHKRGGGTSG